MESLRFSWKEQRILLAICNAISVIWLGSLCRACVGCRLRGPGVGLRLGSRAWEELSVIFTSEVSQCFSSPCLAFGCCSWSFPQLERGEVSWSCSPSSPPSPIGVCVPPPGQGKIILGQNSLSHLCFWGWRISCKGNSIGLVYLAC